MHLLRSKLFSILIVVLTLVGYSEVVRGACSSHAHPATEAKVANATGEPAHSHSHSDGQDCQCVCHQNFPNERIAPLAVVGLVIEADLVFPELADFPPDTVPRGIDYPPQLA